MSPRSFTVTHFIRYSYLLHTGRDSPLSSPLSGVSVSLSIRDGPALLVYDDSRWRNRVQTTVRRGQ